MKLRYLSARTPEPTRFAERLVCWTLCDALPIVALASSVIDWYGLKWRLETSGVNLPVPGGTDVPPRLPPVASVNGFESETLWLKARERTSRELPFGPDSLPMRRFVSEYCTESCTMGRLGVSTRSKGMTCFSLSRTSVV